MTQASQHTEHSLRNAARLLCWTAVVFMIADLQKDKSVFVQGFVTLKDLLRSAPFAKAHDDGTASFTCHCLHSKIFWLAWHAEREKGERVWAVPAYQHQCSAHAESCVSGSVWASTYSLGKHYKARHPELHRQLDHKACLIWAVVEDDKDDMQQVMFVRQLEKPSTAQLEALIDTKEYDTIRRSIFREEAENRLNSSLQYQVTGRTGDFDKIRTSNVDEDMSCADVEIEVTSSDESQGGRQRDTWKRQHVGTKSALFRKMGIHTALDWICEQCHDASVDHSRACGECSKSLCEMCGEWADLPPDVKVARDKEADDYADPSDYLERHRDGNEVLLCDGCWDNVLRICDTCRKSGCGVESEMEKCSQCRKMHCPDCIFEMCCWKCMSNPDTWAMDAICEHFNVETPRELLKHLWDVANIPLVNPS